MPAKPETVTAYIQARPEPLRAILEQVRQTIRQAAPGATEGIAYGMPAYKLGGKPLVYFAAFKNHLGFYATPNGHTAFAKQLRPYKQGKGSVQFPWNQPIPYALISGMVRFRAAQLGEHP